MLISEMFSPIAEKNVLVPIELTLFNNEVNLFSWFNKITEKFENSYFRSYDYMFYKDEYVYIKPSNLTLSYNTLSHFNWGFYTQRKFYLIDQQLEIWRTGKIYSDDYDRFGIYISDTENHSTTILAGLWGYYSFAFHSWFMFFLAPDYFGYNQFFDYGISSSGEFYNWRNHNFYLFSQKLWMEPWGNYKEVKLKHPDEDDTVWHV